MDTIYSALRSYRHKFKKGEEDQSFLKLFVAKRLIQGAAVALLGVFFPIFLYEVSGQQFYVVGGFYAALSLLYVLFLAPGMKIINKIGFTRALVVSALRLTL